MSNYKGYRPELNKDLTEKILKLSYQIGLSPNKVVNVFTKLGLELLEKSAQKIQEDFKIKIDELIRSFDDDKI